MEAVAGAPSLLTITENGFGKRTLIGEYPLHNRGGKGVITIKTSERNGSVVAALVVEDSDEVMFISAQGKIIRMEVSGISIIGRNTQGVTLFDLAEGERLAAVAQVAERVDDVDDSDSDANGEAADTDTNTDADADADVDADVDEAGDGDQEKSD